MEPSSLPPSAANARESSAPTSLPADAGAGASSGARCNATAGPRRRTDGPETSSGGTPKAVRESTVTQNIEKPRFHITECAFRTAQIYTPRRGTEHGTMKDHRVYHKANRW